MYGPLESWFDKTWKLGDFELIELRVGLLIYSGDCPWEIHRQNPQRKRSALGQWIRPEEDKKQEFAAKRGHIRNIYFKNIAVSGLKLPKSYLIGYNDAHSVENVVIENLSFNGSRILDPEAGSFTIETAKKVRFAESKDTR